MISPMTDHYVLNESPPRDVVIPRSDRKILEFAAMRGVDHRTVREWLRKGLLPTAYKDGRGRWWIPEDAQKLEVDVAPRVDDTPSNRASPMTDLARHHPPTLVPSFIPLYMTLVDAAPLLGVTAYQIAQHPDEFGVVPWGERGALVVPVRRLLGLTS